MKLLKVTWKLVFAGSYLYRVMQICEYFFILMISTRINSTCYFLDFSPWKFRAIGRCSVFFSFRGIVTDTMSTEETSSFLRDRLLILYVELFFFPQTQINEPCNFGQKSDFYVQKGFVIFEKYVLRYLYSRFPLRLF